MRRFTEAAPEVRIEIVQGIQSDLRTAVLEDRIDLAIGAFGRRSEAIVAHPLCAERQSIYCGVRHPFFERAPDRVSRSELEAADWVQRGYSLGPSIPLPVEIAYSSATAANIEGVVMIILAGRHIGVVPDHFAQPFEERGALRRISPATLSVDIIFSLISRKGRRDTGAMRGFRQALDQVVTEFASR